MASLKEQAGTTGAFVRTANMPTDAEGRVYHLKVKRGEVANRIISVGDPNRAEMLSHMLDKTEPPTLKVTSNRGFTIYTGLFRGVPISIIATGMGIAMIDFVVRESLAIIDGPVAIVRFGTCGTPRADVEIGSLVVASKGSVGIIRKPDGFADENSTIRDCYHFTKPVSADQEISQYIIDTLKEDFKDNEKQLTKIRNGLNATADTFYASQGRILNQFNDKNEHLLDELLKDYPEITTLEMETFHLFDLARISYGRIRAAATCIVIAQRVQNRFIDEKELHETEHNVGRSVLRALTSVPLPEDQLMTGPECVWLSMKGEIDENNSAEERDRKIGLLCRETRTLSFTQYPAPAPQ